MFDDLNPRSPVPLYEQIAARIRLAVASEELVAGEALPSVRQLATTLRVNPATVVQAYRDLERDGFVDMRHGAGTFVQSLPSKTRDEEKLRRARELVRELAAEAARVGISGRELQRAFEEEVGCQTRLKREA